MKALIERLKAARLARGLTQRDLSVRAGVPQSHISRIESGAVDIKLSSFIELARVLGLEPVLVPRKVLPAVEAVIRTGAPRPDAHEEATRRAQERAYALNEEEEDNA